MTDRVTQQLVTVGYVTSPEARFTAMAIEVIRTNDGAAIIPGTSAQPLLFVICS